MKSTKAKVLIFTDWYLPGYKAGGPIRSCANLVHLLGDEIDFKVVCLDHDYLETEPYANVLPNKWINVGKADVWYISSDRLLQSTMKEIMLDLSDYQVYINGVFSKYFSVTPLIKANKLGRKITVAPRGMLAEGALSIKPQKKKAFLNLAKFLGLYRRVRFHATNADEANQIKKEIARKADIQVIPNLPSIPGKEAQRIEKHENSLKIISVARIAREKNTAFALECFRNIDSKFHVEINFVGTVYDSEYFSECKIIADTLPANVAVTFSGAMPSDSIAGLFAEAHLFFLPTLGENYGHAIIESLLNGLPVLISDKTPWKNLQNDGLGVEMPLSEPSGFVNYISQIAAMSQADYDLKFSNLSEKAASRVHLKENIEAYKLLFQ
ncbi:glycosyltransferase [Cryomorpha ignava]|uniref:Glycosyltransferase n=1 Tax=Cryomorpha ignava TaxID=101383 RepID=A0A7K3WQT9_9FLAO|nr:glycosyltransferase [Cryomorpha ignava]NEN24043.1 glycosyltransferase [Cryomorpha ignava]